MRSGASLIVLVDGFVFQSLALVAFILVSHVTETLATNVLPIQFQKVGISREHRHAFQHKSRPTWKRRSREQRLEIRQDVDDNTVRQLLENKGILYLANVTVGTPPQPMQLQIDTASSDIWVFSKSVPACADPSSLDFYSNACGYGSFDPDVSSTFKLIGEDRFNIAYVDSSSASGDYAEDTFCVGGKEVKGMQIGVAKKANVSYGVMGVGFEADQASAIPGGMGQYPNLVNEMVSQGLINSKAFSLWLDDLASDTGCILFGGIDTERFIGNLTSIPLQRQVGQQNPKTFSIPLTSIALSDSGSNYNITSRLLPTAVILDSGSSLTFLPYPIASSVAEKLSAKISEQLGLYIIDCNYPTENSYIKYTFSYIASIRVPLSELILPLTDYSGNTITYPDGSDICALGFVPSPSDENIFGDTFLRSAYIVYDLDNERVAIAPTQFNPVGENIIEIGTGNDSVPYVTNNAMIMVATGTGDASGSRETNGTKSTGSKAPLENLKYLIAAFTLTLILILNFQ